MACAGTRKQKQSLTLSTKQEILRMYDATKGTVKLNELAKTMKLSRRTLMTIVNNRSSIEGAPQGDGNRYRIRNRKSNPQAGKSKYQELDEVLAKWVKGVQRKGEVVSGVVLRKKALEVARDMGLDGFTASNGWTDRFKKKLSLSTQAKHCGCPKGDTPAESAIDFLQRLADDCSPRKYGAMADVEREDRVEGVLATWLQKARREGTKISGSLIKETALTIAGLLGDSTFTGSAVWLETFQKKYQRKECEHCRKKDPEDDRHGDDTGMRRNGRLTCDLQLTSNLSAEDEGKECDDEKVHQPAIETAPNETREDSATQRLDNFQQMKERIEEGERLRLLGQRLEVAELEAEVARRWSEVLAAQKENTELEIFNYRLRLQSLQRGKTDGSLPRGQNHSGCW